MMHRHSLPLRHLRAPNASPLTGTGTNTYVVGRGEVAVIDPGPDDQGHLAAILGCLAAGETISHIVVTHPHRDHSALARRLAQASGAIIAGFGTATDGRSPVMQALADAGFPDSGEGLDHSFRPDLRLGDGAELSGASWRLRAIHTPGHLGAHLCLAAGDLLFSGDHVMGWSTSIVAPPDGDMADYMASLRNLSQTRWSRLLPGHGEPVEDPASRIAWLLRHREDRAAQILAALQDGPADARTLARRIYAELAPHLIEAARANVLAHLIDFTKKQRVTTDRPLDPDSVFHPS